MELHPRLPPLQDPLRLARMQKDASQVRRACGACGAHLYVSLDEPGPCGNCGSRDLRSLPRADR